MKKIAQFRDVAGQAREPYGFVFPIFAEAAECLSVIGTGFFVGEFGIFLTAAHVATAHSANTHELFVPHLAIHGTKTAMLRRVLDVLYHKDTDVALGILESAFLPQSQDLIFNDKVVLSSVVPSVGEEVTCYSFPQTQIARDSEMDVVIPLSRWAYGKVLAYYPAGRDRVMQRGICVETDLHVPNGGSGGPVFNANGQAFGVVSSGIDGASVTYVAPFTELLDIPFAKGYGDSEEETIDLTLRSIADIDRLRPALAPLHGA